MKESYAQRVSHYYNSTAELYLSTLGTTCQAGLILGFDDDPYRSTNTYIAEQAKIKTGHRILDAGSGFCGPSIHICQKIEGVFIDAITISEQQAQLARVAVAEAGLSDRITIHVGDFHQLSMQKDSFDVILFIESSGYSPDLTCLYQEIFRVTRPGGRLYIKDVFCDQKPLTAKQRAQLQEFEQVYVHRTYSIKTHVHAIIDAGFRQVAAKSLNSVVSTDLMIKAMWEDRTGERTLTEFGRIHYRAFDDLPVSFAEIWARKETSARR
jgi:ubiquinone/menaquinone biosynthesis C-methylase UbiE